MRSCIQSSDTIPGPWKIPVTYLGQEMYAHLKKVNENFYSFLVTSHPFLASNTLLTNICPFFFNKIFP